ncbi:hypothetical protein GCM10022204_44460 [Microlunatus aurantiacus]|uniref:Uncharacterized protein n=1 Tax=Microlunatus aurantiacus TaxID=446786 RepID=A0ABP7EIK8_9ACTN
MTSERSRPIDDVLVRLGHRLPWLLGSRRDLIAEVRGGLEDAAEAHRRHGLSPDPPIGAVDDRELSAP